MLRTIRDLATSLALLAMTGVSLAATWQVIRQGLPGTPLEERRDTLEWLASEDLAQSSLEAQRTLVRRLEQELNQRTDWPARLEQIDEDHRQRMQANLAPLARRWFLDLVDQYAAVPESDRDALLDQQFNKVERWRTPVSLIAREVHNAEQEFDLATLSVVLERVQEWTDEADPDQQDRILEFREAFQTRVIARELERLAPSP